MSAPASRQGLIDYCLKKLGHPVTEINVDDDQVNDRIDDAFQFYQDFHYDAIERIYLKHKVTASQIVLTTSVATRFIFGETVTGQSSGQKATVTAYDAVYGPTSSYSTSLVITGITGNFTSGETILGSQSGFSSTIVKSITGDMDNQYIDVPDGITGIVRIMPFTATNTGLDYMFDLRYQLRLNDLFDLMNTSIIYYQEVKAHLDLINMLLVGEKSIHFQRHMNRLFVDMRWGSDVRVGEYILIDCYRILDPNEWTNVYNDRFLKRYATALVKKQWGENIKKFAGIQMPGGVTLNGDKIWQEAVDEIEQLEVEMRDTYVEPPNFFIG